MQNDYESTGSIRPGADDPGAAEPRKRLHVARIALRWRDMDANRHVNNTLYFRYFEQARIEWCDAAYAAWAGPREGFVIAAAHCNYLRALMHPATIEVVLYAGALGRSSFAFHYDLFLEGDRSLRCADGYTRQVWIERASGRPQPLPDALRELLA